jgi:ketosteroid isomerase-like protein
LQDRTPQFLILFDRLPLLQEIFMRRRGLTFVGIILVACVAWLASARLQAQDSVPKFVDPSLRDVVIQLEEATRRFNAGDPSLYSQLTSNREEVTLLGGAGGHEKGREKIITRYERVSGKRKGADFKVTFEYLSFGETKDMAYTVAIERRVTPNAAEQTKATEALRATHIFRKEAGVWKLIHRHADPLVEEVKK